MDDKTIERLRDLRVRREQRARESVLRQQIFTRVAAAEAEAAGQAVTACLDGAANEADAALSDTVGRPVPWRQLQAIQADYARANRTADGLRQAEAEASARAADAVAALGGARAAYCERRRSVARLERLIADRTRRSARRRAALDELAAAEDN